MMERVLCFASFGGGVIQVYEGDFKDVYATVVRIVLLYGGDGMNWCIDKPGL